MSVFSQFGIYGYAPIGASVLSLDAPINYTSGAAEYLRTGNIKTYNAAYGPAIAVAPQLSVFGTSATTYGTATSSVWQTYYYVGSKYVEVGTAAWNQGGSLNSLGTGVTGYDATVATKCATNGTYLVIPLSTASSSYKHKYTTDGITATSVTSTRGAANACSAIAYGNSSWISLSSLSATANEQEYIANANPSGSWTLGASTNLSMSSTKGIAYGAGVFVAVGTSASATAGKIATTATVGSAWTDRTSGSGITFGASDSISDIIFDGTAFVAITSTGNIITSTTGTGSWTLVGQPMDLSTTHPLSGAASWAGGGNTAHTNSLSTDGAGTVVYQPSCSSATIRPVFSISTDHGATWKSAQTYIGKTGAGTGPRTMSYANGRWISNIACATQSLVDIGTSFSTPNYVGMQANYGAGQYVRIK